MYILLEDCNFILLTFNLNFELHWPRVNFLFNLSFMAELFLLCRHGRTVFTTMCLSFSFNCVFIAMNNTILNKGGLKYSMLMNWNSFL